MNPRFATPGELGGPVVSDVEVRDGLGSVQVSDVDEGRHEVLVHFPHDVVDTYKTTFRPTCFRDSYEQRLPVMCWQHDLRDPIGRAVRAQVLQGHDEIVNRFSTLEAVPNAKRAFSQIVDGTLTDFSMGFKQAKYEPTKRNGHGVRAIVSAVMVENSPVSVGSIPGAKATGIREEGGLAVMELEQIIHMRDAGYLDEEGFRALMGEHYPELSSHIVVTSARAASAGKGVEAPADEDEDETSPIKWTALKSGTNTATGPNDETLRVKPFGDSGQHVWLVLDEDGSKIAGGIAANVDKAKGAAERATHMAHSKRSVVDYLQDGQITANSLRALVEDVCPEMAEPLRGVPIAIGEPADASGARGADMEIAGMLAEQIDAALDSAAQWLQRADVAQLPDDVQQGLALVQSASLAADALLDTLGIPDSVDNATVRAATTFSTKPWSDFKESDYTNAQWREACLLDTGEGSPTDKARYKLPVKEPDGTYNRHGIAAAAARLNQTEAGAGELKEAAQTLVRLYTLMKATAPPNVTKFAGVDKRDDEPDIVAAATARLDRVLARRK